MTGIALFGLVWALVAVSPPGARERASAAPPQAAVDDMICRDVRAIFDAPEPDRAKFLSILTAADQIYIALDAARAASGQSRIYARMNKTGRLDTQLLATSRCARHPTETLRQAAVASYEAREALGRAMGLD